MNKIFLWCVATGTGSGRVTDSTVGGDVIGYAMAENGEVLASHLSSDEDFSKHDMGLTSDWKHDKYMAHYPDGYELEWVTDTDNHTDFAKAFALNQAAMKEHLEK